MNANELADLIGMCGDGGYNQDAATMLRQQQAEIERLNYDMEGFKQNFFVSGFHLQIKMANEQLVKQQDEIEALKNANRFIQNFAEEQHQRAVALEMRELTDEEIGQFKGEWYRNGYASFYDLVRAILRKAQNG